MTTQPPSNEAVEAALDYAREMSQLVPVTPQWIAACDSLYKLRTPDDGGTCGTAGRILAAEVERLRAKEDEGCEWQYDDHDCKWGSNCGEAWQFMDGDPDENNVRYCQGCGRKVKIQPNENEQ